MAVPHGHLNNNKIHYTNREGGLMAFDKKLAIEQ